MESVRDERHTKRRDRRALKMGVVVAASFLVSGALAGCQAVVSSSPVNETYLGSSPSSSATTQAAKLPEKETPQRSLERKLTVVGTGDLMIHPSIAVAAEQWGSYAEPNFYNEISSVEKRVKASDLAVCHVETPFSQPGVKTPFPHYYVHPNLAKAIAQVGFRECSTASNWTADKGFVGAERTVAALKAAGVGQSGIRIPETNPPFKIRTIKGVKVAHLSYTDPHDSPGESEPGWAVNNGTPGEIAHQAQLAREQGAEVVIVSLAMGAMGMDSTTESQASAVKEITKHGDVNLIIGHGSHTVQPAEKVNGTWVIWHGNLISSFFPDQRNMHVGLLSQVKLKETSRGVFEAVSATGYPVLARPGSGKVVDLASSHCSPGEYDWYVSHLQQLEAKAVSQGFKLRKPCGG